jgi:cell division protein FtsI (penicillin-binding protein 3)
MRKSPARPRLNLLLEGSLDKAIKRAQLRLLFLTCAILITLTAIAGKTVQLTFFYAPEAIKRLALTKSAMEHNNSSIQKLQNEKFRKSIYDRNGILLSSNLITSSLYANPKIMLEPEKAAEQVTKILTDVNRKELEKKFKDKTKSFVWVKRSLHPKQKYEINALGIPGLMFEDEEKRIYPHGKLFSHVIGMVGQDGHGLSGLERFLDNLSEDSYDMALKENNINTTLDTRVQNILRDELQKSLEHHQAFSASGVVMDVNTGEILALASLPDYDPNLPKNLKQNTLFNNVTLGSYELGSVFKPFTLANAFDSGKINEKMIFDATEPLKIGRFRISDFHAKKRPLTVPEVLMYSSNIGAAKIGQQVGAEKMQEYYKKLGFYDKLDVEVIEKSTPTTPRKWSESTLLTASFGHGLAVSPLHLAAAMSAVVNGGLYYQPTLIKRTKGQELTQPLRVYSKRTSERMRDLLRLVVVGGSGTKANIDGYLVGGKTGTAEKIDERGRYSTDKVVSTFVGAFPMNNPRYIVVMSFDDPKPAPDTYGYVTAGWVAAPPAGRVIQRISPILKVRPQEDDSQAILDKFNIEPEEE